jgi:diguanylate cyclase (GGDEF)-like protein
MNEQKSPESKLNRLILEVKTKRGLVASGYAGNPDVLQKVRAYEEAGQVANQQMHHAATRGEDLERLALLDPITELYNHRPFVKELEAELKRARRYKYSVGLLMFTVDGFEGVVRQYGQLTGETVQKVVSGVIKSCLREGDIAAKYGGPLFVVAMPKTTISEAALVVEKIREKVGNQVITYNWQNFSVTASIGLAAFPDHASQYDELIARATEVMELAIERGGDRVLTI